MVTGPFSQVVKRPGRETVYLSSTGAEVKNEWIYTSTHPYSFMTDTETTLRLRNLKAQRETWRVLEVDGKMSSETSERIVGLVMSQSEFYLPVPAVQCWQAWARQYIAGTAMREHRASLHDNSAIARVAAHRGGAHSAS